MPLHFVAQSSKENIGSLNLSCSLALAAYSYSFWLHVHTTEP